MIKINIKKFYNFFLYLIYLLFFISIFLFHNSFKHNKIEIKKYKQIVRSNPTTVDEHFNLGIFFSLTGNYKEAINEFKKVVRQNTHDSEAYFRLGMELNKNGQTEEAKNAFTHALNIGKINTTHSNLGLIYYILDQYENAILELKRAINEDEPHKINLMMNMASCYVGLKQYHHAINALENTIKLDDKIAAVSYNVYYDLGLIYQALEMNEDAIKSFKMSQKYRPEFAFSYINLGMIYVNNNNNKSAYNIYKKLKVLDQDLANQFFKYIKSNEKE